VSAALNVGDPVTCVVLDSDRVAHLLCRCIDHIKAPVFHTSPFTYSVSDEGRTLARGWNSESGTCPGSSCDIGAHGVKVGDHVTIVVTEPLTRGTCVVEAVVRFAFTVTAAFNADALGENWAFLHADEGRTWARGWGTEAARALRAADTLMREDMPLVIETDTWGPGGF